MLTRIPSIVTARLTGIGTSKRFRTALILLLTTSLLSSLPLNIKAQQDPVKELKEQIAVLTEVQKRPGTTSEVKQINARALRERQRQLVAALQGKIQALREYREAAGKALNSDDNQLIEKSIRDLESELKTVNGTETSTPVIAATMSLEGAGGSQPAPPANISTTTAPARTTAAAPPEPQLTQADCYPNAPPALIETVNAAAFQIVDRKDPTEVTSQFFQILFFSTAHAVSVDAVDADAQRRDMINKIDIARLKQETQRTDKQVGASATAEGSTTAAEKPGFAELLGFAIEPGAIQQEVNGTTLTLSSSPYMLVAAASGDNSTTYSKYGYLSRLGVSANFKIDNNDNVLANARRNQLSEWSLRARITGDRSDRSRSAEAIWQKVSGQFAAPDLVLTKELSDQFQRDGALAAQRREIEDRFLTATFTVPVNDILKRPDSELSRDQKMNQIAKMILCQVKTDIFDQVRSGTFKVDENTRKRLINKTIPAYQAALDAKEAAIKEFEDGLKALSYKPVLTFAYNNKRDPTASDYSVLRLLFQKKMMESKDDKKLEDTEGLSIIANAGVSLYHKPNAALNQKNLRDFFAALSFEGTAGRSPFRSESDDQSRITFSFSGRYQRLFENRGRPNVKADIGVAQFKLEVPIMAGISLPFSVTYANASELIKEDHVRANFGFTFDTDKLLQVLKLSRLP